MAQRKTLKGITIEIGGDTTKLGKALEGVETQSKNLQSELKGVNSLLKLDPKNVELLSQKQELLTKAIEETKEKQNLLNQTLKQIDSGEITAGAEEYRDLQREIVSTEQKLKSLNDQMKDFGSVTKQQLTQIGNDIKDVGSKIEDAGKKVGAISTVAAAGLTLSAKAAVDNESAINRFITSTGLAVEKTDEYKQVMEELYSSGYGESIADIADKMALVRQNLGDISSADLKSVTESAYLLEDAFGMDFSETLRGVNGLINNMGLTATEAFDYLVTGAQNGLDKSHELADNIAEYSQIWAQAGFSAEEMFTILQNGLDSGAYNLDKVNDFVKEFTISLSDGRIEESLGSFSKNTQNLFESWQDGGATASQVFYSVINDLKNMTNEQEALTLASNTWSALGEDNAMSVITSLGNVSDEYTNVSNSVANATETMYGGAGAKSEEAMRSISNAFAKVSEVLLPIISNIASKIAELAEKFSNLNPTVQKIVLAVTGFAVVLAPLLITIGKIVTAVGQITPALSKLTPIITGIKTLVSGLFSMIAAHPVIAVITAIIAAITLLWNKCEWFRDGVKAVIDFISGLFTGIVDFFKNNWQTILTFILNPFAGAFKLLYEKCDGFREFIDNLVNNIKEFFTGLGEWFAGVGQWLYDNVIVPIMNFFEPLVEWFVELFQSIRDFIASVFTVIGQLAQGCVQIIMAIWGVISTWFNTYVITPIKNFFTELWNTISGAAQTAWNFIVSIWTTVSTWFSDTVITPVKNVFSSLWDGLKNGASSAWEGIKSVFSTVADFFKNIFTNAWTAVKNVFSTGGKIFDGIKDGIVSAFKTVVNAIINGINKVVAIPFNAINAALRKIRDIEFLGISPFKKLIGQISVPQIPTLAVGTDRIPEEGLYHLHEGERVVPKKYNPVLNEELTKNSLMDALTEFAGTKTITNTTKVDNKVAGLLETYFPAILKNMGYKIVLDDDTLVGKIAPKMNKELGAIMTSKKRGR